MSADPGGPPIERVREPGPASAPPTTFDFAELDARTRYKLLVGTVVPRPIALVTTVDADGRVNAAPFSFFNVLSHDPALVVVSVDFRPDGRNRKDTGSNIRETGAFTVNTVSRAIAEQMNICAIPFPPEVDELVEAGLDVAPGLMVVSPRILRSPVALECRLHTVVPISRSRDIIIGEVVCGHFRSDVVDAATLRVDAEALDAVGRMSGSGYASTHDRFELAPFSVDEWNARKVAGQWPVDVA